MVLVGDINVDDAVSQASTALRDWTSLTTAKQLTSLPVITGGPLLLVSNEDAQDSQIRLSAQAVGRTHPKYPAVVLANLVLGGYFASRLTANLYGAGKPHTYHANSYIELHADTGSVVVEIDAALEATAEVLNETRYDWPGCSTSHPTMPKWRPHGNTHWAPCTSRRRHKRALPDNW
ncbi:insulinase family protein [Kibdelosporangium philippinense]|uniref:Insulinase family protein n=1 Tax=Kibdelosporangium philippinense TaxID=211113 RepID=A0ABS8ZJM9_9PSEU|nr:insulinase family protein [Kibdelosporangium philippinense]MCE7007348.1 insulinase family protein [Kibdelosporangium philippinense]